MEKQESNKPLETNHNDKDLVLRFYGIWNDTASLYGDKRYFVIHYFMEDDTIELLEQYPNNSGRTRCTFFLHRCRVPKILEPMALVGQSQSVNILNTSGGGMGSRQNLRQVTDTYQAGYKPQDCWMDHDLYVGAEINVYGRKVFIYDCDEQTRNYCKTKYGMDNCPINVREACKPTPSRASSANSSSTRDEDYDIFGCLKTVYHKASPEKNKVSQFHQFERKGQETIQLRFFAKMENVDDPVDRNRTFIISYYLADDTMQIFEPSANNSGFRGGVFLNRQKIKKGHSYDSMDYWDLTDLYVGGVLTLFGRTFKILDADEHCYSYLETHPQFFPKSDIKVVMGKVTSQLAGKDKDMIKKMFEEKDSQCTDKVDPDTFRSILRQLMPDQEALTDHELMTITRFYGNKKDPNMSLEDLATLASSLLQKASYRVRDNVLEALEEKDKEHTGFLNPMECYFTLRSCHMPLEPELLKNIVSMMPTTGDLINYKDLMDALDWTSRAAGTFQHPVRLRYDCRLMSEEDSKITGVRYREFLRAVAAAAVPQANGDHTA